MQSAQRASGTIRRLLGFVAMSLLAQAACAGAAGAQVTKMSFANASSNTAPASQAMKLMGKRIHELSKGTVEVTVYTDAQLGSATSLVQGVQQGTVDMIVTGDSYFSGLVPEIQVFELPFFFSSYDAARAATDGPAGEKVKALFNGKGIHALDFWEIGFRHLTNSIRPIREPQDLRGIKIRTLPAPIQVQTWKLLGALPTPIDYAELYSALQQKVVDAQENPLNLIRAQKFYEVQQYLSLTGHVYSPMLVAVSQKTWDKLSPAQRDAVVKAEKEAQAYERSLVKDGEAEDLAQIAAHKVIIERNPRVAAFRDIALQAYPLFTKKYGDELVKLISHK